MRSSTSFAICLLLMIVIAMVELHPVHWFTQVSEQNELGRTMHAASDAAEGR
jgi:hypothetical protein